MTRDEAANTIYDLRKKASGMPTTSCGAMKGEAVFLADVLVALGMLNLERAQTTQADIWRKFILCIEEQGLEFQRPDSNRFVITSPSTERQRELIEKHKPIGVYIEYAPTPARCEPPPEHQDKIFHWLRLQKDVEVKLAVHEWRENHTWEAVGLEAAYLPKELADAGWRYVAPCLPPKMEG